MATGQFRSVVAANCLRHTPGDHLVEHTSNPPAGKARVYFESKALTREGIDYAQHDALGTTQRVIFYYETDAELPPAAAIVPLARLLEVSTDQLLGLEPAAPGGRQQPQQQRKRSVLAVL